MQMVVDILDAIHRGPGLGEQYTTSRRGRSNARWAGSVVTAMTDRSDGQAASIVKQWVTDGVLIEGSYRSPERREDVSGVTVDDAKISEMKRAAMEGASSSWGA